MLNYEERNWLYAFSVNFDVEMEASSCNLSIFDNVMYLQRHCKCLVDSGSMVLFPIGKDEIEV